LKNLLLIRADASVSIGTGHIMRMIALGQAWQTEGGEVHFLCAEITPALEQRLVTEGFHLSRIHSTLGCQDDLSETLHLISEKLLADRQNARVVLDGYHFDSSYQLGIKAAGFKLLVVDDYGHADFYHADWVLNQNISAREELYTKRNPDTKLLLGPKYAMLRKEFLAYKGWQREIAPVAKKILVTLGGSDPDNVTLEMIQALVDLDLHVKVVLGGSNPHLREIENFIQSQNDSTALIEVIVNTTNMPELMVWADVAVTAAGSTCWELACLAVPMLLVISAPNQCAVAEKLGELKLAQVLGWHYNFSDFHFTLQVESFVRDFEKRKRMAKVLANLVDGRGAENAALVIRNILQFRQATKDDILLIWEWANDLGVRESAFNSNLIKWDDHQTWFNHIISDSNARIFIVTDSNNAPVGQLRMEGTGQTSIIDISIDRKMRGKRLSVNILKTGLRFLFENPKWMKAEAWIKKYNEASISAFRGAGFTYIGEKVVNDQIAVGYSFKRDDLH
jgi:UDP-2,4-diacetamido-2,4,6-trideoxy-beta-L-altropyranose hydrolase